VIKYYIDYTECSVKLHTPKTKCAHGIIELKETIKTIQATSKVTKIYYIDNTGVTKELKYLVPSNQTIDNLDVTYLIASSMNIALNARYGIPKKIYETNKYIVFEMYENLYSKWDDKKLQYKIGVIYKNIASDLYKHFVVTSNYMKKNATLESKNTKVKMVKKVVWDLIKLQSKEDK